MLNQRATKDVAGFMHFIQEADSGKYTSSSNSWYLDLIPPPPPPPCPPPFPSPPPPPFCHQAFHVQRQGPSGRGPGTSSGSSKTAAARRGGGQRGTYCGWLRNPEIGSHEMTPWLKPWFVGIYRGIKSFQGFFRWCEMDFATIHSSSPPKPNPTMFPCGLTQGICCHGF